jgi:hypothetical protein
MIYPLSLVTARKLVLGNLTVIAVKVNSLILIGVISIIDSCHAPFPYQFMTGGEKSVKNG